MEEISLSKEQGPKVIATQQDFLNEIGAIRNQLFGIIGDVRKGLPFETIKRNAQAGVYMTFEEELAKISTVLSPEIANKQTNKELIFKYNFIISQIKKFDEDMDMNELNGYLELAKNLEKSG